jgi:polynucleotide 5'-kinase involved in rRNA processing
MKSLQSYVLESQHQVLEVREERLSSLINEARAYLPKKKITAHDALAARVQELKYISKLSKRERSLL